MSNTPKHIYEFFADIIHKRTGIFYPEKNYYQLDGRFEKLATLLNYKDIEETYNAFKGGVTEDMELILLDVATNNETLFFRDKPLFDTVLKTLIPHMKKFTGISKEIKIWCCACSSGQEPYSIVMGLLEANWNFSEYPIKIYATDIDEKILEKAENGVYDTIEVQRGLPIQLLTKYFVQEGEFWKIKNDVKKHVSFGKFNLIQSSFPVSRYDILLCRNVLIYQKPEDKALVIPKLYSALKDNGVLILGAGESLIGMKSEFTSEILDKSLIHFKSKPDDFKKSA